MSFSLIKYPVRSIGLPAGIDREVQFNNAGILGADSGLVYTSGQSLIIGGGVDNGAALQVDTDITASNIIFSGSQSGGAGTGLNIINASQVWNGTGIFTAVKVNITNTASGIASKLLDLQIGGSTKFSVLAIGTAKFVAPSAAAASINLAPSAAINPTTPNNGDIWYDGTNLKMQIGGVTKTFTLV